MFKSPCLWIKRGFLFISRERALYPSPETTLEKRRMHTNTDTRDLKPPADAMQKIIQYSRRD